MRAFLAASATAAFLSPLRARSCCTHTLRAAVGCRLDALSTARVPWMSSVRRYWVSNALAETSAHLPFSAISGVDQNKQAYQKEIRRHAVELTTRCKAAREAISKLLGFAV